jgi:hypothetical protein
MTKQQENKKFAQKFGSEAFWKMDPEKTEGTGE